MRKIYTTAVTVYVWLGSRTADLRESFDAIDALQIAESACSRLSEQDRKIFLKTWPTKTDLASTANAVGFLFKDEYWSRVWTFQEICLGKNVKFVIGRISTSYQSLKDAGLYLRRYMEDMDAYDMNPQENAELWLATREVFQTFDTVFDIDEMKEMVNEMFQRATAIETFAKLRFEDLGLLGFQMSRCCALSTERKATEPKDYVYGFSALLDIELIPDYSSTTTLVDIYCDLMEQALLSGGNMCLLLLDTAGIGHCWSMPTGLPSWAPNFAGVAQHAVAGAKQPLIKANWASFVGLHENRPPTIDRTIGSLYCTAISIDTLEDIGPCLDHGYPDAAWIEWLFDILYHNHLDNTSETLQLCTVVEATIKSTSVNYLFHPPTTIFGVVDGSFQGHNVLMLVHALEQVWHQRSLGSEKDVFLRAFLPGTIDSRGKTTLRSVYDSLKGNVISYLEQLVSHWSDLCKVVQGLRIARTAKGYVGLYPPRVQTIDLIVMMNTCTNPAVLRKHEGCYAFVGWCYTSAYDGCPIDSLEKDGFGQIGRLEIR